MWLWFWIFLTPARILPKFLVPQSGLKSIKKWEFLRHTVSLMYSQCIYRSKDTYCVILYSFERGWSWPWVWIGAILWAPPRIWPFSSFGHNSIVEWKAFFLFREFQTLKKPSRGEICEQNRVSVVLEVLLTRYLTINIWF